MMQVQELVYRIKETTILNEMTFTVTPRKHTLLLGDSGSGKTTLLHILAGLLTPSAGTVTVDGTPLSILSSAARDRWRAAHVGMIFQTFHLIDSLSILDNLLLAQRLAQLPVETERGIHLLAQLGLADKARCYPHQLSVGQAQRVAIARAVMNRPAWILADEPTSALDTTHATDTITLLEEQAAACGATLLIATHDNRIRERYTHCIHLDKGRIV